MKHINSHCWKKAAVSDNCIYHLYSKDKKYKSVIGIGVNFVKNGQMFGAWYRGTFLSGQIASNVIWLNGKWVSGEIFVPPVNAESIEAMYGYGALTTPRGGDYVLSKISPKSFFKPKLTLSLNYAKYKQTVFYFSDNLHCEGGGASR